MRLPFISPAASTVAYSLLGAALFAGCAAQPSAPFALLAAVGASLWLWSCFSPPPQGSLDDAGTDTQTGVDGSVGSWETCCVNDPDGGYVISQCLCPPNTACNYGWFTHCGDGTCRPSPGDTCPGDDAGVDAGVDAGDDGTWETCCDWKGDGGVVSTCYCPPNTACNYGWFANCDDGSCAPEPGMCP